MTELTNTIVEDYVRAVWEYHGWKFPKECLDGRLGRTEAINRLANHLANEAADRMAADGVIDGEDEAACDRAADWAQLFAERDAQWLWDEADERERAEASEAAYYKGGRSSRYA